MQFTTGTFVTTTLHRPETSDFNDSRFKEDRNTKYSGIPKNNTKNKIENLPLAEYQSRENTVEDESDSVEYESDGFFSYAGSQTEDDNIIINEEKKDNYDYKKGDINITAISIIDTNNEALVHKNKQEAHIKLLDFVLDFFHNLAFNSEL
jgi:hypothetical protein